MMNLLIIGNLMGSSLNSKGYPSIFRVPILSHCKNHVIILKSEEKVSDWPSWGIGPEPVDPPITERWRG
jgi:hypothetical protein